MAKIKLHQFGPLANQESASPFCVKVHYAMRYKRVPFDVVNVGSPLELRKLNPRGKAPVMVYDGATVADSTEIVRFLEARHPAPRLYPQDPKVRAMALLLEDWADESLYWHVIYERWLVDDQFDQVASVIFNGLPAVLRPLIKTLVSWHVRRDARGQGLGRLSLTEQREKLGYALDWLDGVIDEKFLLGEDLSVADIAVAAQVAALDIPFTPVASAEVRKRPNLARWLDQTLKAVS